MQTIHETRVMPQKVLNLAYDLGVHEECVHADACGSCEECVILFNVAFDSFYGEAENSDQALMMILNDILEDRNTEVQ